MTKELVDLREHLPEASESISRLNQIFHDYDIGDASRCPICVRLFAVGAATPEPRI